MMRPSVDAGTLLPALGTGFFGYADPARHGRLLHAVPPEIPVRSALLSAEAQLSLIDRIRQGDGLAEEELVLRFTTRIRSLAAMRTRDRELARDLTQETLMQALSALRVGQLRDAGKLGAFVFGVARNVINNHLRSRGRQPSEEPITDDVPIVDDENEFADRMGLVQRALRRLDTTDQRILTMTLVDGCKPGEISSALGLSSDGVRARKSRALKKVTDRVQRWLRSGSGGRWGGRP
jgi:RNA polymerase sigma-70 factor (ECF subfamily)